MLLDKPTARVVDLQKMPTTRWRPKPLSTTEMQKLGTSKLKLTSGNIMECAEKL